MKKHSILIVDDEPNVRSSLARALHGENYETLLAESASDAFQILQKKPVSVVLSDYLMPGQTGLDFLKEVKTKYPAPVRILLTGNADMKAVMASVDERVVSHFLLKPWDNDVLRKTVRRATETFEKSQTSRTAPDENEETEEAEDLEKTYPGITIVKQSDEGAIIIDE